MSINDSKRETIGKTPLPDNVLIYYSGHNNTVQTLVKQYEDAFRKRIKSANFDETRRFIGIGPEYKQLLLAVLLMQKTENKARQFICHKLGIAAVESGVSLVHISVTNRVFWNSTAPKPRNSRCARRGMAH